MRWLVGSSFIVSLLAGAPGSALAGEEQELDSAVRLIDDYAYDKAAVRFERLLDPQGQPCSKTPELTPNGCRLSTPGLIRRARGQYAIALHRLKRPNDAKAQFRQLLLDDPTFTPSAAEYDPDAIRLFTDAKKEVEDEITQRTIAAQKKQKDYEEAVKAYEAWIDDTEKLAKTETVIVERSRLIAAVPFGVGQFQNDNIGLGILFLSAEAAFAGVAIGTNAAHSEIMSRFVESRKTGQEDCVGEGDPNPSGLPTCPPPFNSEEELNNANTLTIINIASIAVLAATMIAGIIEAEANFESGVPTTRPRKIKPRPPKPVPPPRVGIGGVPDAPDAVGVGVTIQFW